MKRYSYLIVVVVMLACSSPKWMITSMEGSKIALDTSVEPFADAGFNTFLTPFKQQLDRRMNEVIGYVEQDMRAHKPESLLSNWSSDIYLKRAGTFLGEPVDVAIVNLGGLRAPLSAGELTVRNIFELMPFENELEILWLKGEDMEELIQYFASIGGQGVAGLSITIENGKAVTIKAGGQELNRSRIYTVATNDYLAEGNDYMSQLTRHTKRIKTGIVIRDMFIDEIRTETAAGRNIKSKLDGRISNEKN